MMDSASQNVQYHQNRGDVQVFGNSGSVEVTYNAAPSLGPPPSTIFEVPELLSPYFTGRNEDLAKIDAAFASTHGDAPVRCIIYGIPGQGKTQLALRYATLVFEHGQHNHVFWASGATAEKVNEGFARIASLLHLPRRSDLTPAEKAQLAKTWLEDRGSEGGQRRKWLLIVDNIAPATVAVVNNILPRSNPSGQILVTTRTAEVAKQLGRLFGASYPQIELLKLSIDDAARLLRTRANDDGMPDSADLDSFRPVAKALGCLPLAVSQAGSFMQSSGQAPSDLLEIYEKEGEEVLKWKDERFDAEEQQPFMTTTLLALEELKAVSPAAINLLRVLAFLDPEAIPIKHLVQGSDVIAQAAGKRAADLAIKTYKRRRGSQATQRVSGVDDDSQSADEQGQMQIEEDGPALDELSQLLSSKTKLFGSLRHLQRLSLAVLRGKNESQVLWIHDLVQSVFRAKLMNDDERKAWLLRTISTVAKSFEQTGDIQLPSVWPDCEAFITQLQSLNKHAEKIGLEDIELLDSNNRLAEYFYYCGRTEEAEILLQKIFQRKFKILGSEHPSTLESMANLALMLSKREKWDEAESLGMQTLETCTRVLGAEHSDTLESMGNMASMYLRKGKWDKAEPLQKKGLEICSRVLGAEHPRTLTNMNNLAETYQIKGMWDEAEALLMQVLEKMQRALGAEHPMTLTTMSNLASTYRSKGKWDEAESLDVRGLEARKRILGAEHPDTLISMANLASTYREKGKWDEAELLEVQVLETSKRVLGTEHSETLTCMGNLASTYWEKGKWNEAELLEVQVLETSKRVLGADHPGTLCRINNLATTYQNMGKWDEAETLSLQVLEMSKRVLGAEHPQTLTSMANLAITYGKKGKWDKAELLNEQVLNIRKRLLGAEHPDTLTSMNNLALTYQNMGKWDEAEALELQVLETCKKVLGAEHPLTMTSIANLALTYHKKGKWDEAEKLEFQAVETSQRVLGAEHPDTLVFMSNLSVTYWRKGKWDEAEQLNLQVIEIRKRVLGAEHPSSLTSMNNLALTYNKKGRLDEAETLFVEVTEIRKRVLGPEHPDTLISMGDLASTYRQNGRGNEAENIEVEVVKARKRVLGPDHPDTLRAFESYQSIAFSPDDRTIVSGSVDRTITIRDTAVGDET